MQSAPVKTHILFLLSLLILCFSPFSRAQVDPRISWRMIDTEHFTVIYDAKQEELGKQYAKFAEQAYASNFSVFGEAPRGRTVVVLNDAFDTANGSAMPVPYPLIIAYPVLPTPLDSIDHYGVWGRELLTHEFTHISNFTPAHGFWAPLRSIFGTIIAPGAYLPRWYLEGTAVEMETRLSRHGRLRSPLYHAVMHAMSLEQTLHQENIARANEDSIPAWPGGSRPYYFGSFLMHQIAQEGGDSYLSELNQRYSRRVPYFLSAPLIEKLNRNYEEMLATLITRLDHEAIQFKEHIEKGGQQSVEHLPQEGINNYSPAVSPDGQYLAYVDWSPNHNTRIAIANRSELSQPFSQTPQKFYNLKNVQKISWFPDSKRIVFDATDVYKRYSYFSDLYVMDVRTKKRRALTKGMRAMEPAVSPDGKWVVFRQNTKQGTRLARVESRGRKVQILYTPEPQVRVARPEYISDTEIVFAERANGVEVLRVLNLKDKSGPRTVLRDFDPAQFARQTSQGLLFMSTRTGVANLYLADASLEHAKALTNTLTRAMTPELDRHTGDVYFSHLTGSGYQIARLPQEELRKKVSPPAAPLPDTYKWPQWEEPVVAVTSESQDYSAWRYMIPRYWMPYAYSVDGGYVLQASTATADPLKKHAYELNLSYDSLMHRPSGAVKYSNAQTTTNIDLYYANSYQYVYSTGSELHTTSASILASRPLPTSWNSSWTLGAGWVLNHDVIPDYLNRRFNTLYEYDRTGPSAFIKYENLDQKGDEISPESGSSLQLQYTSFLDVGPTYKNYDRYLLNARTYFSKYLPRHHAILAQVVGIWQPGLRSTLLGSANAAMNYETTLLNSDYTMRGYSTASFVGRHVASATLEYRFPLWYVHDGGGTQPLFIRRLHGALIADGVTLDGAAYNFEKGIYERTEMGRYFVGTGAELRTDLTIAYNIPATFVMGGYVAQTAEMADIPFSIMMGFRL